MKLLREAVIIATTYAISLGIIIILCCCSSCIAMHRIQVGEFDVSGELKCWTFRTDVSYLEAKHVSQHTLGEAIYIFVFAG